ncbi:unnamed protein product [Allacma fusca]|uniref:Protein kinase domain-containing protein n=1 Tax=Allacma fusca TaxID=39272 RepID=A0A8J2PIX1_9HEXA|nr:unnamed protein product [Allacma fusca]
MTEIRPQHPNQKSYNNYIIHIEPPPPRNLSSTLLLEDGTSPKGEASRKFPSESFTLMLTWLPPTHTNDVNIIQNYIVEITSFSLHVLSHNPASGNLPDLNTPGLDLLLGPFHLQGNVTQIQINSLKRDVEYQVSVIAVSEKGPSLPARLTVSTKQVTNLHAETIPINWIYLSIPIVTVFALGLTCHFARNFLHKRKIKAARNSYFKSMEERDAMTNEWSIVPLNEEYCPFKLLDENFPKEKWDIGFQNLQIGDIIGQGAFGVVRKAKMPRKKYVELQHKHKKLGAHLITTNVDDDISFETVAVKMLKAVASKSDRDELIKEIVTMQNLGNHPQIVSLLGACTRARSVCLVLEYCPGGDLLSFLRKVRRIISFPPLCTHDSNNSTSATSGRGT